MKVFVKHTKTGGIYEVVGNAINATNDANGQSMVMYRKAYVSLDTDVFVREEQEFWSKFQKIDVKNKGD